MRKWGDLTRKWGELTRKWGDLTRLDKKWSTRKEWQDLTGLNEKWWNDTKLKHGSKATNQYKAHIIHLLT